MCEVKVLGAGLKLRGSVATSESIGPPKQALVIFTKKKKKKKTENKKTGFSNI